MSLQTSVLVVLLHVALWGGATLVACRLLSGLWDRVFGTAVLGWTLLMVGLQVLSFFGQLRFTPVAILLTASFVVAIAFAVAISRQAETPLARSPRGSNDPGPRQSRSCFTVVELWSWPALATAVLALVAGLYYLVRGLVLPVEPVSDAPIYHLYFAVRWWQAGRIEMVATPFGELAATYFPAGGSLWFCWLVMLSGSELLAKVGQWPFWLLGGMVVYALARKSGACRCAAIFPAAFWATGSSVLLQGAGLANVDLIAAAWYLIGVYFLARLAQSLQQAGAESTHRSGVREGEVLRPTGGGSKRLSCISARSTVVLLFGLAAGAALGTHATALFFVPLLLAPAVYLILTHAQRRRHLVLLAVGLVMPSGYWFARNWTVTGNPIYPVQVDILGLPVFSGWYDSAAMRQSNYHIATEHLAALAERSASVIDMRASLLMRAWSNPRLKLSWSTAALVAAHLSPWLLGVAWGLAGPISAARKDRGGSARHQDTARLPFFLTLLGISYVGVYWWLVPYQSQQRFLFPAAAVTVVPFALLLQRRPWLQAAAGAIVAAHLLLPIWPGARERGFAIGRHPWQSTPSSFYPAWDFAANLYPAWQVLEEQSPPEGASVAYAGTNLPYYLFGRGLRNQVYYVNVNKHAGFLPHDYHHSRITQGNTALAPDPWPDWYREDADYDAWLSNLSQSNTDLLFVARENQHGRPEAVPIPPLPIEFDWARTHPEHFEAIPVGAAPGLREPWAYVFRVKKVAR